MSEKQDKTVKVEWAGGDEANRPEIKVRFVKRGFINDWVTEIEEVVLNEEKWIYPYMERYGRI